MCSSDLNPPAASVLLQRRAHEQQRDQSHGPRDRADHHREHGIAIGSLQRTLHLLLLAHGATVVPAYAGPVDHRTRRIVTLVVLVGLAAALVIATIAR